jgi:hypothetical protein
VTLWSSVRPSAIAVNACPVELIATSRFEAVHFGTVLPSRVGRRWSQKQEHDLGRHPACHRSLAALSGLWRRQDDDRGNDELVEMKEDRGLSGTAPPEGDGMSLMQRPVETPMGERMMRTSMLFVFSLVIVTACSGGASTSAVPASSAAGTSMSVSGTWTGTSTDTTGQGKMTWTLTQNANAMTGTMNISDTGRSMMGNGSMQGTVSGSTVTFHMVVPTGGFGGMMSSCSMSMEGKAQMSDDGRTMTGTYSGSMSGMMSQMPQPCGGPMSNGSFTLTR